MDILQVRCTRPERTTSRSRQLFAHPAYETTSSSKLLINCDRCAHFSLQICTLQLNKPLPLLLHKSRSQILLPPGICTHKYRTRYSAHPRFPAAGWLLGCHPSASPLRAPAGWLSPGAGTSLRTQCNPPHPPRGCSDPDQCRSCRSPESAYPPSLMAGSPPRDIIARRYFRRSHNSPCEGQ